MLQSLKHFFRLDNCFRWNIFSGETRFSGETLFLMKTQFSGQNFFWKRHFFGEIIFLGEMLFWGVTLFSDENYFSGKTLFSGETHFLREKRFLGVRYSSGMVFFGGEINTLCLFTSQFWSVPCLYSFWCYKTITQKLNKIPYNLSQCGNYDVRQHFSSPWICSQFFIFTKDLRSETT